MLLPHSVRKALTACAIVSACLATHTTARADDIVRLETSPTVFDDQHGALLGTPYAQWDFSHQLLGLINASLAKLSFGEGALSTQVIRKQTPSGMNRFLSVSAYMPIMHVDAHRDSGLIDSIQLRGSLTLSVVEDDFMVDRAGSLTLSNIRISFANQSIYAQASDNDGQLSSGEISLALFNPPAVPLRIQTPLGNARDCAAQPSCIEGSLSGLASPFTATWLTASGFNAFLLGMNLSDQGGQVLGVTQTLGVFSVPSAVPETGTWAMALMGLGVVAAPLLRRRSSRSHQARTAA